MRRWASLLLSCREVGPLTRKVVERELSRMRSGQLVTSLRVFGFLDERQDVDAAARVLEWSPGIFGLRAAIE